jgi:hypothetical protein
MGKLIQGCGSRTLLLWKALKLSSWGASNAPVTQTMRESSIRPSSSVSSLWDQESSFPASYHTIGKTTCSWWNPEIFCKYSEIFCNCLIGIRNLRQRRYRVAHQLCRSLPIPLQPLYRVSCSSRRLIVYVIKQSLCALVNIPICIC